MVGEKLNVNFNEYAIKPMYFFSFIGQIDLLMICKKINKFLDIYVNMDFLSVLKIVLITILIYLIFLLLLHI